MGELAPGHNAFRKADDSELAELAQVTHALGKKLEETRRAAAHDRQRANTAAKMSADLHDKLADALIETERLRDLYEDADTDLTVLEIERDDLRAENEQLKAERQSWEQRLQDVRAEHAKCLESWDRTRDRLVEEKRRAQADARELAAQINGANEYAKQFDDENDELQGEINEVREYLAREFGLNDSSQRLITHVRSVAGKLRAREEP